MTNATLTAFGMTNGQFRMQFPVDPGVNYLLQGSSDLSSTTNWQTILSTNSTENILDWLDPFPGNFSNRFYRVLSQ